MPNELTREHAKALYELAINSQRSGNYVHTLRVLEKVVETKEPFYTPFALAAQSQCYNSLGRRGLDTETLKRITELPEEQQQLLNPDYLALCYQRSGNRKKAKEINAEILQIAPTDGAAISALAELSILDGRTEEAEQWAIALRNRVEPGYHILGRMIGVLVLLLNHRGDEAEKELRWVGQFLISTGNIPLQVWDYRDLQ